MKQLLLHKSSSALLVICALLTLFGMIRWLSNDSVQNKRIYMVSSKAPRPKNISKNDMVYYRRKSCSCTRPLPIDKRSHLVIDETSASFCSQYATFRGFHQRIIAISIYGPQENSLFEYNSSMIFMRELIDEMKIFYPGWILRIYHDESFRTDDICTIECANTHVDFCNASSLDGVGDVRRFMPPRIWRYLPAGERLVDVMCSRDLDSPLAQRELDAVKEWLSTDKQWHVMRDHPLHNMPILAGLWGFRPELNRTMASIFLNKLLDNSTIYHYGGRGDQAFLAEHIWPIIQGHIMAHDSYLCEAPYGKDSKPWPKRRPMLNATGCFAGCVRPCCQVNKYPFGECPMACRPKNHTDWTMC